MSLAEHAQDHPAIPSQRELVRLGDTTDDFQQEVMLNGAAPELAAASACR